MTKLTAATAVLVGLALVCAGIWLIFPPAGLITLGLGLTLIGLFVDVDGS